MDLSVVDKNQQNPLFYALAARGNRTMVAFLLNMGFETNYPDYITETAIFIPSEMDATTSLPCLYIEHGASLDVISTEGRCPRSMLSDSQHYRFSTPHENAKLQPLRSIRAPVPTVFVEHLGVGPGRGGGASNS